MFLCFGSVAFPMAGVMSYARRWDIYFNEKISSFRPEVDKTSAEALDSILYDMVVLHSGT